MSPMRDTYEQSTDASLLGMGDAVLALCPWLSASEGPELLFDWVRDSLQSPPFTPMTLSVGHISVWASNVKIATVTLAEFK